LWLHCRQRLRYHISRRPGSYTQSALTFILLSVRMAHRIWRRTPCSFFSAAGVVYSGAVLELGSVVGWVTLAGTCPSGWVSSSCFLCPICLRHGQPLQYLVAIHPACSWTILQDLLDFLHDDYWFNDW
jgi:hypothetical protein